MPPWYVLPMNVKNTENTVVRRKAPKESNDSFMLEFALRSPSSTTKALIVLVAHPPECEPFPPTLPRCIDLYVDALTKQRTSTGAL